MASKGYRPLKANGQTPRTSEENKIGNRTYRGIGRGERESKNSVCHTVRSRTQPKNTSGISSSLHHKRREEKKKEIESLEKDADAIVEIPYALYTADQASPIRKSSGMQDRRSLKMMIIIRALTPIDGHIVFFVKKSFQLFGIDILDDGLYFLLVICRAWIDGCFLLIGGRRDLMGRRH